MKLSKMCEQLSQLGDTFDAIYDATCHAARIAVPTAARSCASASIYDGTFTSLIGRVKVARQATEDGVEAAAWAMGRAYG